MAAGDSSLRKLYPLKGKAKAEIDEDGDALITTVDGTQYYIWASLDTGKEDCIYVALVASLSKGVSIGPDFTIRRHG